MINVQMSGLDEIIDRLQESPEVFRDARSRELEDIGQQLLPRVRAGIGGTGRIQNLQDVYMGSGKGYVAVRPKAGVFLTTPVETVRSRRRDQRHRGRPCDTYTFRAFCSISTSNQRCPSAREIYVPGHRSGRRAPGPGRR